VQRLPLTTPQKGVRGSADLGPPGRDGLARFLFLVPVHMVRFMVCRNNVHDPIIESFFAYLSVYCNCFLCFSILSLGFPLALRSVVHFFQHLWLFLLLSLPEQQSGGAVQTQPSSSGSPTIPPLAYPAPSPWHWSPSSSSCSS